MKGKHSTHLVNVPEASTRQLFHVTNANNSSNSFSRDDCYTLAVIKPCYSVESSRNSSMFQAIPEATPTQPTVSLEEAKLHGDSFAHSENEGTVTDKWTYSRKLSIMKDELQGAPLMKTRILDVYSDVFTGIGKFPRELYKFQLKPNVKSARHAPRKVPIHLQDAFHKEIQNLEQLEILELVKDVTEWVNNFVIMENDHVIIAGFQQYSCTGTLSTDKSSEWIPET